MLIDDWLIFAYIMIFSSVILCGFLPIIFRLYNARRRFHRYDLERQAIKYTFLTLESIYSDVQIDTSDIQKADYLDFHEQIPYIDEDTST
jgi:Gpi18-like mannosyltransferase